ncbi:MAG: hypothetical protein JWN04_893 [Myxococcaceae bacterium]|nr:hypothetical protein [Myxococcaceae bacterium]
MSRDPTHRAVATRRIVYRWDVDKTYLNTDFDSLKGLFRAALEKAEDKVAFPGAKVLLRELCETDLGGLYILSGSPEQMRKVIEQKLVLDGIKWDGLVLKPSLNRLLRGRFRFLRDQVSYKLNALLSSRLTFSEPFEEVMFGDDAEADAFVYSLYSDLCAGRVGLDLLAKVLELARAYDDDAAELLELARQVPKCEIGRRIFIHLERLEPSAVFSQFGPRVFAFHNYFQPALMLLQDGLIDAQAVLRVGVELVRAHAFSPDALAASYADLARRRVLGEATGKALRVALQAREVEPGEVGEALAALAQATGFYALPPQVEPPSFEQPLDYLALLPSDKARAKKAKTRARARPRR